MTNRNHRADHSPEGRDYAEAFDILVDVQSALVLTANFSDGATVASFVSSSTQYDRLNKFLHARQDVDPRSLPEGRSNGAGEDEVDRLVRIFRALPLHGDAGCDKLTDDEWRAVALATLTAPPTSEESAMSEKQITVETIHTWKLRERAHFNGGKEWFGYGYQCIDEPRLYRIDRYMRSTKTVVSEWQVDGYKVDSLEAAADLLNRDPVLIGEECQLLQLITPEFQCRSEIKARDEYAFLPAPFEAFHFLDRKGMVEWEDGRVRLTRRGQLAKLAIEESNASGTPSWEVVSRRVNAERAALSNEGAGK